jgi:hypothetical protein
MNKTSQKNNQIDEFYLAAREFCRLAENTAENNKIDFLSNSQKILTLTYLKANLLNNPDGTGEGEAEKFVQEEDWSYIQNAVAAKIGSSDRFIEIIIPDNSEPNNVESESLSDCYADVYQDLKDFVVNYEFGNPDALLAALVDCILNFEKFWGPRLLAILVNTHCILFGNELMEDEDPNSDENSHSHNKSDTSNWLINERFNQ